MQNNSKAKIISLPGIKIKNFRSRYRLSKEEMANCMGVDIAEITSWEDGNSFPDEDFMFILETLDHNPDVIF